MSNYIIFLLIGFLLNAEESKAGMRAEIYRNPGIEVSVSNEESIETHSQVFDNYVNTAYTKLGLKQKGLSYKVFHYAMTGYYNLESRGLLSGKKLLTIADMQKSANAKRLFVIDLANDKVLYQTWVAHGNGSGNEYAKVFSNVPNSYTSSLGWYVTDSTYFGKHGLSLIIDGIEKGYNDKARERAIVIHGAEYVSASFIKQVGRLGRSQGCPALPMDKSELIINTIQDRTALFIYYPEAEYLKKSEVLNGGNAAEYYTTFIAGKKDMTAGL